MEIFLLLCALLALLVPLLVAKHFIKRIRFENVFKVDLSIVFIGVIYLLFSLLLFSWNYSYFSFEKIDFLIVYAVVLASQMIGLTVILYEYNHNPKIMYTLFSLIILLPLAVLSPVYLHLIIPLSLFVILLSFLIFSDSHQQTTTYLIAYSTFSLLSYIAILIKPVLLLMLSCLSTLLFVLFMNSFLEQLKNRKKPFLPPKKKKENIIIHFLKHFIFIVIITNFIFIGTIGIHELGHLAASNTVNGCEGNKIIYELDSLPHTQVNCEDTSSKHLWVLAGILLPLLLSALLFFGGGESIKEISLQIIGINLIISFLDFQVIGISKALSFFILLFGIFLFSLSLFLLAKIRTQQ